MRIFIGMWEVAGCFTHLEEGLQRLGHDVRFVNVKDQFQVQTDADQAPWFIKTHRQAINWHGYSNRRRPLYWAITKLWLSLTSFYLFLWALLRFDVFIFSARLSFFRGRHDLPFLKLLGKKVYFVFHGSEIRPPYINAARMYMGYSLSQAIREAAKMKHEINRIERYADAIVADPPFAHFLNWHTVALAYIGKAAFDDVPLPEDNPDNQRIRILHIPSKRNVKGTTEIEATIQRLIDRGYPIDFKVITGVPHAEVRRIIGKCDFLIDNLYSDTNIGVVGGEAAQYGKPAIIAGYVWDELRRFLPEDRFPAAERCHPDNLETAIIKLIENPNYRRELGQQAKEWVNNNWMPETVATNMMTVINGQAPDYWYFDPNDIRYLHGHGLSDQKAREFVAKVIETGGVRALQLHDKPQLERLAIGFAHGENIETL